MPRDRDPAHDVLAAEAFAMGARDPDLHAGPVLLPDDPTGIPEPHDVLAAEEFPMPAPRVGGGAVVKASDPRWVGFAVAVAFVVAVVLRRRRRR